MARAMTRDELLSLPAVVDIRTAGSVLGLGKSKTYELAAAGEFPVRVLRVGNSYRVPTAELLLLLGIEADERGSVVA